MKAIFIGTDGSMGFQHGKEYEIHSKIKRRMLWIECGKLYCPYTNLESFLENWRLVDG